MKAASYFVFFLMAMPVFAQYKLSEFSLQLAENNIRVNKQELNGEYSELGLTDPQVSANLYSIDVLRPLNHPRWGTYAGIEYLTGAEASYFKNASPDASFEGIGINAGWTYQYRTKNDMSVFCTMGLGGGYQRLSSDLVPIQAISFLQQNNTRQDRWNQYIDLSTKLNYSRDLQFTIMTFGLTTGYRIDLLRPDWNYGSASNFSLSDKAIDGISLRADFGFSF